MDALLNRLVHETYGKVGGKWVYLHRHRQVKYSNNVIEADHAKLKPPIRPVRGFKTLKTARATIAEFEVMRTLPKGQAAIVNLTSDIHGKARVVEQAFGLDPSAFTETMALKAVLPGDSLHMIDLSRTCRSDRDPRRTGSEPPQGCTPSDPTNDRSGSRAGA